MIDEGTIRAVANAVTASGNAVTASIRAFPRTLASIDRVGEAALDRVAGYISGGEKAKLEACGENAQAMLSGVSDDRLKEPDVALVKPLLESCTASQDELVDLFAALLANAMVRDGVQVRREYISIARELEPSDALLLKRIAESREDLERQQAGYHQTREAMLRAGVQVLGESEHTIALQKLSQLRLIAGAEAGAVGVPVLTAFGRSFLRACTPPAVDAPVA